jgi:DNA-binding FadR family transcriptional regulator
MASRLGPEVIITGAATGLRGRIGAFLRAATTALEPEALERHAVSHDELLDAIVSGDPEAGCAEMTRHIELATERLRGTLDEQDDDD